MTGSEDATAKLWDAETGRELRTFKGHGAGVNSVAFSPDGIHWTRQDAQPIAERDFGVGAGIGFMKFFNQDGTYYLFLEVVPTGAFSQIHLATFEGSLAFNE